jgi:iron complex transport system permease protein
MARRLPLATAIRGGKGGGFTTLLLAVTCLLFGLLSLSIGRYSLSLGEVAHVLAGFLSGRGEERVPSITETVLLTVRLPRVGAAMGVGAGLALAGAVYQGVFRNPLVSPFVLGISGGAGFGAAIAILFLDGANWAIQACAFLGGGLAVLLCHSLTRSAGRQAGPLPLILSGIVIGALFSALLGVLKYAADPEDKLPLIEFWLMGSLSGIRPMDTLALLAVVLPVSTILHALRWRLTVLGMGEEEARALGVNTRRLRPLVLALATLLATSAVAVAGVVGWVGLITPHVARILVGPTFQRLIPASLALGACFLALADSLARTVSAAEIPLGIITALAGVPVLALLIRRGAGGWHG